MYKDGKYVLKKQNVMKEHIWEALEIVFVHIDFKEYFVERKPCISEDGCTKWIINVCFEGSKICNSQYIDRVVEAEYLENWFVRLSFLDGTSEEKYVLDYVEY